MDLGLAAHRPEYGIGTVLLVDDEPDVRKLVGRILLRQGYTVFEASDGEEAIRFSQQHDGPINLLLTDVVMPGISGRDLAEQLAPLRPEMRVLFMSGRMDDSMVQNVANFTTAFIPKPFTPDALVGKVRDVLGAKGYVSAG